jgi:F-type H+-transporting ATPase subunit epsilon
MRLEISTPEKTLFAGEVFSVQCPGKEGSFQILDRHAPMIAILVEGRVKYETTESIAPMFIDIGRGILQVLDNKVTILLSE